MKTIEVTPSEALEAAVLRWPSREARAEAQRLVKRLCSNPAVASVVVFGSSVRRAVQSFDLDLLYIYDGERPGERATTMQVDLRAYPRERVAELLSDGHDMLSWSLKFGVAVCDRHGYWQNLKATWLPRLPLPSAEDARRRASKAWETFSYLVHAEDSEAALEQYLTYLTHVAREELIESGSYPASRPELPDQLRAIGAHSLAVSFEHTLRRRLQLSTGFSPRLSQFLRAAEKRWARSMI